MTRRGLSVAVSATFALAGCRGRFDRWHHDGHMMDHGFWMIAMWIGGVVVLVAVVLLVVYLARSQGLQKGPPAQQSETALDILEKRYAAGEISQEEYEVRKRDLGH